METQSILIVSVALVILAVAFIAKSIIKRHNNKRAWHDYWSDKGTFGHCGQNIKCHCMRPGKPSGPWDLSYFFSKEENDEMDRIIKRCAQLNTVNFEGGKNEK
ncbi:MAG: hypothetical protein K2Y22_06410 [Candidatus Obscuribacterales bacterium]|nr:hypothetical protein [Candidatus Obscuribacterales bacterium]